MKKYLALLLTLCLVLSVLFPVFSMAEEVSPSPSEEVSPSPSEEVSPSPSEEVSPSPSEEVSPSPSEEVSPSPLPSPSPTKIDAKALYETFMAITDDAEAEKFLMALSEEELQALEEYALTLKPVSVEQPETESVTIAGPLMYSVSSEDVEQPNMQVMRLMTVRTMCLNKDTDGVELSKTIVSNGDGTYTVRLESYTTGKVSTTTTGVPADIVLVLDQSGSMSSDFDGSATRQEAMKSAVTNFISAVETDAAKKVNHRIAIVTFASGLSQNTGFSSNYANLKAHVNGLPSPNGATNVAAGMQKAKDLISSVSGEVGRNKVVVVFTDGVPTTESDFNTDVATGAIAASKEIKDMKATVYTIGIFSGAKPSELYGEKFDYGILKDVPCDGAVGSVWGASFLTDLFGDVRFIDIGAGNRFLNYLSSNYAYATNIGIKGGTVYPKDHSIGGNGYEITQNFTRTAPSSNNYYLSASHTAGLNDIFQSISQQIGTPTVTLGSNVEVRDVISEYFDMPTTNIRVSTVACTGKSGHTYTWSSTEIPLSSANITQNASNKTISVGGFAYDDQFVTSKPKSDGSYGSKLVISFEITPRTGFWGGNRVPTNGSASGLYAGTGLIEDFEIPYADVPINVPFTAKNVSAYLGNTIAITDLYNPISKLTESDEWKDDFVDIENIRYTATFDNKPSNDQNNIIITATVPPLITGIIKSKPIDSSASISVYKPEITFKDSTIYLGEMASYSDNFDTVIWKHGDAIAVSSNMIGAAPTLDYKYSKIETCFKADTPVDVSVKVGDDYITPHVTFVNKGSHLGSTDDIEFTVFVKTCELTVKKLGCNSTYGENQTFILHITGKNLTECDYANQVDLTVVVIGNGEKTIIGLPVGVYTVTEEGGWSWRYTASTGSVKLNRDNISGTLSVVNALNNNSWLSGTTWHPNVFARKAG